MSGPGARWTDSQTGGDMPRDFRADEQKETDEKNRRSTLIGVLDHITRHRLGPIEMVELINAVGLEGELLELAGSAEDVPERHRRLVDAWSSAGLDPELGPSTW